MKYVRGNTRGIEQHEIAPPIPKIARAGQQVVHLIWLTFIDAQPFEIELDPAGLHVMRIEIDDGNDDVGSIGRRLAITDQLIVVDRKE